MNGVKWLLDTNVVIGLLKKQAPAIALLEAQQFNLNQSAISQITRIELLGFPGLTQDEEIGILAILENCSVFYLDDPVERQAIHIRRTGSCKLPDAIIAATARVHRLKLLTLDQRLMNLAEIHTQ